MVYGQFPSSIPFIRLDLHSLLVQPKPQREEVAPASANRICVGLSSCSVASFDPPLRGWTIVIAIWLALARNPPYLESTWRKERVVMRDAALTARDKRRVALAVSMNARSRYMIEYNTAILRHAGDGDEDLLEVLGVVDHYTCLNTLSDGMQIESDIRP